MGVKPLDEALSLAKEKDLDLIEIVSEAKPPVTKIYDFDKYRYEKQKEEQQKRKQQKAQEMKNMSITPRTAKNDLETKARKVDEFLEKGHRVELSIHLKGREKANKDFAKRRLLEFVEMLETPLKTTKNPKYTGRGFNMQVVKE